MALPKWWPPLLSCEKLDLDTASEESVNKMQRSKVKTVNCPGCGCKMQYKGSARYECHNGACDVIEIDYDQYMNKIKRIKRSAIKPDDYMVGSCGVCGNLVVRKAPATMATCKTCYINPGCVVEVKLTSPAEFLRAIGERFFAQHPEVKKWNFVSDVIARWTNKTNINYIATAA